MEKLSIMLVNFTYSNFMAYLQPAEFSMVAGQFKAHRESLMNIPGERYAKLLPISAIYGGNASGKSTFVHAVKALRHIVLTGKTDHVETHLFSAEGKAGETRFCCSFVVDSKVMEYEIHLLGGKVTRESLTDITRSRRKIIFNRIPGEECEVGDQIVLHSHADELTYATKMGSTLPDREVFLTTIMKLQVDALFAPASLCYRWFNETLCIIEADSRRVGLGLDLLSQLSGYSSALADADTGVERLEFHRLQTNIEDLVPKPILSSFRKSDDQYLILPDDHSTLLVKEKDDVVAIKCYSAYSSPDGDSIMLPLAKESDGTRRYLHLLPMLLDKQRDYVYIVDELDRSLHTLLTKSLIQNFRKIVENKERHLQLIFTTHDVALMENNLFRKDEIWVTERDELHQAHLVSMAHYKDIRPDNQLRKSYLEGRMGGLPNMESSI